MDLDQLWDFTQPAVSESRFRAALAETGDPVDAVILRTQLARSLGLQGRFDEGFVELDSAHADLDSARPELSGPLPAGDAGASAAEAQVRIRLERGRLFRSSDQPDLAVPHFEDALALSQEAGIDHLAADAAHMLAIVGSPEEQLERSAAALSLASASADPRARRWIGPIENNLGWTLHGLDRHDEALAAFVRALASYEAEGDPERIRIARWTVARGLRAVDRLPEALAIQRDLEANGPADGYVHEELAELLAALGQPEEAERQAERARELLGGDG